MSNCSPDFANDFTVWDAAVRSEGETDEGIAEIKQAIRGAWLQEEAPILSAALAKHAAGDECRLPAKGIGRKPTN